MESTRLLSAPTHSRTPSHLKARTTLRTAIATLFCVAMLFGTTLKAHAAGQQSTQAGVAQTGQSALTSLHTATPLHALVSCSGTSCNAKDPGSTGCSSDGYIVPVNSNGGYTYYYQGDALGIGDGYMNLMYSPTCGTNWSYVNNDYPSNDKIEAQVDNLNTGYYYWNSCYNCASRNSLMTYAPTAPTEADGWIRDPTWPNGLLIEPCLSQSTNACWGNLPH
jgi:hypothetical protein